MSDYRYDFDAFTLDEQEQAYQLASAFHLDEACDCVPILSTCMDQAFDRILSNRPAAVPDAEGCEKAGSLGGEA